MKLKKGMVVVIYEDPITKLNKEGNAVIRSIIKEDNNTTRCMVSFHDSETKAFEDAEYERRLSK